MKKVQIEELSLLKNYADFHYHSSVKKTYVSNLRKKLKIFPDLPDYIKSVYGIGYKFEVK